MQQAEGGVRFGNRESERSDIPFIPKKRETTEGPPMDPALKEVKKKLTLSKQNGEGRK
jgi:hypothetical protein